MGHEEGVTGTSLGRGAGPPAAAPPLVADVAVSSPSGDGAKTLSPSAHASAARGAPAGVSAATALCSCAHMAS